jgi:WXG100 family type VII secretion target
MANVHVDYEQLRSSASRLKSGQEDITGKLTQLKTMIDNLVSSGFVTDKASGKFQESYRQWDSGAKNVINGLQGMNEFLSKAISQHEQLDQQLSQSTGG